MTQAQLARASVGVGSDGLFGQILGDIGNDRALDRCTMLTFTGLVKAKQGLLEDAEHCFSQAASAWRAFGDPWEAAQALRDRGRCLAALDRTIEAAPPLREAKEVFARLGARPDLAETEELLAALV